MASRPQTKAPPPPPQKAPPGKAVVLKKENAVAHAVPDFMKAYAGAGTEMITGADIETPRIKLLQAISPEVEEFDDARNGEFWHTTSETSLGKEVRIVPIYIDIRAILWRPRHDGGGILARADDGVHWVPAQGNFTVKPIKGSPKTVTWSTKPLVAQSGLLEWGSSVPGDPNSMPAATKMYNMVVVLPDFPDLPPGVVTLQRSGIRVARKFLGKLKISKAPSFGMYFTMDSIREEGEEGPYNNYRFTADGLVTDEDEFHNYRELYERFKEMGLQIRDLETVQEDVVEATSEETGAY
jgi:hypothetical protein